MYFLTFYTEGSPVDRGYDLKETAQQIKEKLAPYFSEVFLFNKTSLKQLKNSEDICNEHDEYLDQNPNANWIGYFDFKPFLIDHILKQIPEGAILIYHDANFIKNPQYWESDWPNIKKISELLLKNNNSDVFVQIERDGLLVKEHVKTWLIDELFTDPAQNNIIKNCKLINAARIIIRNTKFSRTFIKEYLQLCKNKLYLAKTPNPTPDIAFKWSCGDQDVLNCLVYKYILDKKLMPEFPKYSFKYRVMRLENKPFVWSGQSWNPHPTGISVVTNSELIEYMKGKQ